MLADPELEFINPNFTIIHSNCEVFKGPLKTRSIGLRFTIVIWWFTDRNCTFSSHFKPLDGGIEAQPKGAVEIVPLKK